MHKKKGKWQANIKDTYWVENLNEVVLAYITKLYDTIKDRETVGIPMYYVKKQADIQGLDEYSHDVDLDAAHQLRLRDLEELIWTYSNNEPDIRAYDFDIKMQSGDPDDEGMIPCTFEVFGEDELERYHADSEAYWERKLKGYELAGKLWNELQW